MSRLIREYKLAWMKVDFNFELGQDAAALSGYYERWYALLDELRAAHPGLFLEGCASGGMRFDLNTLKHFDGHFLSDTVNPYDVLRIAQGALLRLPPGRLGKWTVLRSIGQSLARYGLPIEKAPETVVVPGGAGWDDAFATTVDFAARAALWGQFGISGDIAGLGEESCKRLRHHIAFFKQWRSFIGNSVAHLLTPIASKEERRGWVAFQLQSADADGPSLVFAHRLNDVVSQRRFRLCELKREVRYRITGDDGTALGETVSGAELMTRGLAVDLPQANRATVLVVSEEAG
jgi:alpha-galactosidase